MKKIIPLLFIIIAQLCPVKGQDVPKIVGLATPESVYKAMDLEYIPVEGFSLDDNFVSWEPYTSHGPSTIIHTEHNNFFCLIDIFYSVKRYDVFLKEERNIYYFNHIRDNLIDIAGKYNENKREDFTQKDLKRNVKFLSRREARKKFNADMAITYKLPVIENINYIIEQKGKEYTHCDVLMIHKNDLGPIFLYCFYTDEGYKHQKQYYNKLEKAIGFKQ